MTDKYLEALIEQVKPATGCTEPVAIALATAKAASLLKGNLEEMIIHASKGIYKNASNVGIPGMKEKGFYIAAALGYAVGEPGLNMRILEAADDETKNKAREILNKGLIKIFSKDTDEIIYLEVEAKTDRGFCKVILSGAHDRFTYINLNGEEIATGNDQKNNEEVFWLMRKENIEEIKKYIENIDIAKIAFLKEAIDMNMAVSAEGLSKPYGLQLGRGIERLMEKGVLGNDLLNRIRISVSAACDARMGGAVLPVMTSCGSGNQGILITIPLNIAAKEWEASEERLLRSLAFGNLVNIFAKSYLGKLSPLCGCSVSAGLGLAAGLAWLNGCNIQEIKGAISGMLANLTGTLCDGAKGTCAYKLDTAAVEAFTYAMMAKEGFYLDEETGIVEKSCESSIANLQKIGSEGMSNMDNVVLEILGKR